MIGFSRNSSDDRFYNPPAIRRLKQQRLLEQQQKEEEEKLQNQNQNQYQNQNQNQNQNLRQQQLQRQDDGERRPRRLPDEQQRQPPAPTKSAPARRPTPPLPQESRDETDRPSVSPPPPPRLPQGNLDRFLESTTPTVHARMFSKGSGRRWKSSDRELNFYFCLGDLWESFKEWSAYGAGVPLVLNGSDSVVQYYVPYLSGMQLYVDPAKPASKSRLSLRDKPLNTQEVSSSEDGEAATSSLAFEYLENDSPYIREPLADKISALASQFPQLKTYMSCDLLPCSWISVAWYPIYRIPTGPTLHDLEACFLTYHTLSTPSKGVNNSQVNHSMPRNIIDSSSMPPKLSLAIFGLALYKFKSSVWASDWPTEREQAISLKQAAETWLRNLNVHHPDFSFFASHGSYQL